MSQITVLDEQMQIIQKLVGPLLGKAGKECH